MTTTTTTTMTNVEYAYAPCCVVVSPASLCAKVLLYPAGFCKEATTTARRTDGRNGGGGGSCTTWGNKSSSLEDQEGGPSPYWTQDFVYACAPGGTGLPPSQEFPAAAYGPLVRACVRACVRAWVGGCLLRRFPSFV